VRCCTIGALSSAFGVTLQQVSSPDPKTGGTVTHRYREGPLFIPAALDGGIDRLLQIQRHVRIGAAEFGPRQPRRMPACRAEQVHAARPFDEFRHPVPGGHQRVDPLDVGDRRPPAAARNELACANYGGGGSDEPSQVRDISRARYRALGIQRFEHRRGYISGIAIASHVLQHHLHGSRIADNSIDIGSGAGAPIVGPRAER